MEKCRICERLGNHWAIGCSSYDFIAPYPNTTNEITDNEDKVSLDKCGTV